MRDGLRLATWNVEWFAKLFDDRNGLLADGDWSARYKVTRAEQADAIGAVLSAMDADLVVIIEAPDTGDTRSTVAALEGFAAHYGLRQRAAAIGFASHTRQEIAALYDPERVTVLHDPQEAADAPRFDGQFRLDVDVDDQPDAHVFSKPPFEMLVEGGGIGARVIGVHAKSKSPAAAKTEAEAIRLSIANRRKQLAQCIWLRRRIDAVLAAGEPLVVMGDLNDGPGLDHYEKLFGRSSVEVVRGDPDRPEAMLYDPHAEVWLNPRQGWSLSTARFYHRDLKRYVNALLDYAMVSRDLKGRRPRWRIWHPFDDPKIFADAALSAALIAASDHFPVTLDLG